MIWIDICKFTATPICSVMWLECPKQNADSVLSKDTREPHNIHLFLGQYIHMTSWIGDLSWDVLTWRTNSSLFSRVRGSVINNNGLWIEWLDLLTPSCTVTINYNHLQSSHSSTAEDSLHSLLDYECHLFYCDWLCSDLLIGRFFYEWFTRNHAWLLIYEWTTTTDSIKSKSKSCYDRRSVGQSVWE
jgi:hypothetical protein